MFFCLFSPLYESPKQHPKEENKHFRVAAYLSAEAQAGTTPISVTYSAKWTVLPRREAGGPLTTGSAPPQWPGCGPSCSRRLQRPKRRRQPAGPSPEPAFPRGCPPASAAPVAAGPRSGWAPCPRCPCKKHTRHRFMGGSDQEERQSSCVRGVKSDGKLWSSLRRAASCTACASTESHHENFGSTSYLLSFTTAGQA